MALRYGDSFRRPENAERVEVVRLSGNLTVQGTRTEVHASASRTRDLEHRKAKVPSGTGDRRDSLTVALVIAGDSLTVKVKLWVSEPEAFVALNVNV